jgi:hypothetical protein
MNGAERGHCDMPCDWCLLDQKRPACQCGPEEEDVEGAAQGYSSGKRRKRLGALVDGMEIYIRSYYMQSRPPISRRNTCTGRRIWSCVLYVLICVEGAMLVQVSIFCVDDVKITYALLKAGMGRIKRCGKSGLYVEAPN